MRRSSRSGWSSPPGAAATADVGPSAAPSCGATTVRTRRGGHDLDLRRRRDRSPEEAATRLLRALRRVGRRNERSRPACSCRPHPPDDAHREPWAVRSRRSRRARPRQQRRAVGAGRRGRPPGWGSSSRVFAPRSNSVPVSSPATVDLVSGRRRDGVQHLADDRRKVLGSTGRVTALGGTRLRAREVEEQQAVVVSAGRRLADHPEVLEVGVGLDWPPCRPTSARGTGSSSTR